MATRLAGGVAVALVALTASCSSGGGSDDAGGSTSASGSPSGAAGGGSSSPAADPTVEVPTTLDGKAFCGGIDEKAVTDFLGAKITRRSPVQPGDPEPDGSKASLYGCDYGTEASGAAPQGVALYYDPEADGTAEESRKARQQGDASKDGHCTYDDVPGISSGSFVESCQGVDDATTFVPSGTTVRVDVGKGSFACAEYSSPKKPTGIASDDVVAFCLDELAALAG